MMLLGLIGGLLLYSQTHIFNNWRVVLLVALGLFAGSAAAYVLLVLHMRKQEKQLSAKDDPAAALRELAGAGQRAAARQNEPHTPPG